MIKEKKQFVKYCGKIFLYRICCSIILLILYNVGDLSFIDVYSESTMIIMALLVALIVSFFINYEVNKTSVLAIVTLSSIDAVLFMILECFELDDSLLGFLPVLNYVVVAFQEGASAFVVPFWLERVLTVVFVFASHFLILQKKLIKRIINAIMQRDY